MKDEGFYNKAWKSTKNKLKEKNFYFAALKLIITVLFALLLICISIKLLQVIWYSFNAIWDDPSLTQSEQPLQLAIGLLTLLVTIIAIVMGVLTWLTRREWERFKNKQEPIIEELKKETEEINWLDQLRKSMKKDPHLNTEDAKGTIQAIKKHYFGRDQYNEAWKYFGVARRYENEKQYSDAINYHEKAVKVDLEEDNIESNELHKHIWQSLGKNYFLRGRLLEDDGKNADAIKDYEAAIVRYNWVIEYDPQFAMAHFNKASTLIQLGKIKGDKTEPYNKANYCYKEAITSLEIIEDNYEHFYDKARAHARLNQPDKAIESLRHSFTLAELAERDLGKLFRYLKRDSEDFKNVEGKEEFKALVKRY